MKDSNKKSVDNDTSIRRKLGMLTRQDLINAYTNADDGTSLEYKQLVISMSMLMVMLIMTVISAAVAFPGNVEYICLTMIMPISVVVIFAFNAVVFKERIGSISKYGVILMLVTYVCGTYFMAGGLLGPSGVWMVFTVIFSALALRGAPRQIVVLIEGLVFLVVHLYGLFNPERIGHYPEGPTMIMLTFSVAEIMIFATIVVVFQTRVAMQTTQRLVDTTNKLNEALTSQKLFTASMNHELRAPLNGVLGCMQMLQGADNLTKSQHEIIGASFRSANALVHIVNDLLDYAKIEAGEFQIIKDKFDLKQIIDESATIFANLMREKGLKLTIEADPDMPCLLYNDGARLQQIVNNLLSNAVKYTPSGEIWFRAKVKANTLSIEVQDTGEGISEEALEVLFTPFKRLNEGEHKKIQGTGLGLYVTYSLAKRMGGNITVDSTLGEGTTFTVTIPVEIVDETVTYSSPREVKGQKADADYSGLNLLCVDDSKVNLMVFDKVVGKATNANITLAESGKEALELVASDKYDVIFLDHQMPDMDGVETFKRIRDMNISTPIIALTADAGSEKMTMFMDIGFDGFVEKPMKVESVMETLGRLFNQ